MAALLGIVYSLGIDIFRISKRCSQFGWSIDKCFDIIKNYREEILIKRYLEEIETFYNIENRSSHSIGIECVNCRERNKSKKQSSTMCDESVLGYVDFDTADEAFEVISKQVSFFLNVKFIDNEFHSIRLSVSKAQIFVIEKNIKLYFG